MSVQWIVYHYDHYMFVNCYVANLNIKTIVCLLSGAALEGFLRFPETAQDFPSMMGVPLFSYKVSRGMHSGLNSSVTGFCFDSKLRKCSEDLFFWLPWRKIGDLRKNLCCSVTGNSAWRSHRTCTAKVHSKQAVWKLLNEISRTAPACSKTVYQCQLWNPMQGLFKVISSFCWWEWLTTKFFIDNWQTYQVRE